MAAVPTPTLVQPTATSSLSTGECGASIVRFNAVIRDTTDGTLKLADCNSPGLSKVLGVAITPAAVTEWTIVCTGGAIELAGVTLVPGMAYYLGATPGQVVRESDLATGHTHVRVGIAETATRFNVRIDDTQIVLP